MKFKITGEGILIALGFVMLMGGLFIFKSTPITVVAAFVFGAGLGGWANAPR